MLPPRGCITSNKLLIIESAETNEKRVRCSGMVAKVWGTRNDRLCHLLSFNPVTLIGRHAHQLSPKFWSVTNMNLCLMLYLFELLLWLSPPLVRWDRRFTKNFASRSPSDNYYIYTYIYAACSEHQLKLQKIYMALTSPNYVKRP